MSRNRRNSAVRMIPAAVVLTYIALAGAHLASAQLSTEDHVAEAAFWPTQMQPSRDNFVGAKECSRCHKAIVESQSASSMGRAAMPAEVARVLRDNRDLSFRYDRDVYRITYSASGNRAAETYTVTDGTEQLSYPLLWAFGTGRVGQSYLFKKEDGQFYEARVTYFERLRNLGFTPDRALTSQTDLVEAMGRSVPPSEVLRCFNCHATAASIAGNFDEVHMTPGVSCEACHGPGANHVRAMSSPAANKNKPLDTKIFSPMTLSPTESVEFCGSCHGSFWDVKLAKIRGVSTARSAPYRLVTSKCWGDGSDDRIICTACHNPHEELNKSPTAYDSACLKCHVTGRNQPTKAARITDSSVVSSHPGKACPVASQKCPSCHMPKVLVPEMNDVFTDHRIRIVKPGESFPE